MHIQQVNISNENKNAPTIPASSGSSFAHVSAVMRLAMNLWFAAGLNAGWVADTVAALCPRWPSISRSIWSSRTCAVLRGWRSFCTAGNAKQQQTHQHEIRGKSDRSWCDGRSDREREKEREMFYLTTHSTHFIYGYMASDIWLRTILIVRKETRCRHIGYSYRLTARVILYAPSHRQHNTYHGLCYTSRVPRIDPSWWTNLSYISFQPVLHDWCVILSVAWCI